MTSIALLCTDGSDLAFDALSRAVPIIAVPDRVVLAAVADSVDPMDVVGSGGMAGGVTTAEEATRLDDANRREAQALLDDTARRLGLDGADTRVLVGAAGQALCDLAVELGASVMVVGTRGHGGLRRAVLGSVSDHVVRNAPCPVVVVNPAENPT